MLSDDVMEELSQYYRSSVSKKTKFRKFFFCFFSFCPVKRTRIICIMTTARNFLLKQLLDVIS